MIQHNRPLVTPEDRAAVDAVLRSGWIAQGAAVDSLEKWFEVNYRSGGACALSSGTAALYVALLKLGAGPGATVAVPTYACSALLHAVRLCGARPVPIDVLEESFCISAGAVAAADHRPEFTIAVHAFGAEADIAGLARTGTTVIEDCCQSLGAERSGHMLGGEGRAAVFSFYATKIVTGGQGGLLWSGDASLADAAREYRDFDGRVTFAPGFNFQMTDIQAALVNSQLGRLAQIRAVRRRIAGEYRRSAPPGVRVQSGFTGEGALFYRFVMLLPDRRSRDALSAHLRSAGVDCRVPIERFELLHRYLGLDPAEFPVAERLVETSLSLPLHAGLESADVAAVCEAMSGFRA